MKFILPAMFAMMFGAAPALGAVEQCRFIQSKPDREACYERQEKALAARRKPDVVEDARTTAPDEIKIENDRLSKSLRSICRGC